MWTNNNIIIARTANSGLAKVAVQCSADTIVLNQTFVLRINICGKNPRLGQAKNRCKSYKQNTRCKTTLH